MSHYHRRTITVAAMLASALTAACRGDPASPAADVLDVSSSVVSIVSAKGGAAIDPTAGLTVTFNHAMMHTDSMRVVLHEGDRSGPEVPATASWAADRTKLTLTPTAPLKARTGYTVELRCTSAAGHSVADHAAHHGGAGGMMGAPDMMRAGMHSGSHGMTFTFSTS